MNILKISTITFLAISPCSGVLAQTEPCINEPNIPLAKLWWPDERNVWTPIGWKDHFFKFNVVYDGAIVFEPFSPSSSRPQALPYKGQGFQATFIPWPNENIPALPGQETTLWTQGDGGHGLQGWDTNYVSPVLWTDYPCQEGVVFRVETFGHVAGGDPVKTGLEPYYAWIRVSVIHVDPLSAPKQFPMIVQLSRNYYAPVGRYVNDNGVTVDVVPEWAPYPRTLSAAPFEDNGKSGLRIVEPDGKIRFAVLPTASDKVSFFERSKGVYGVKLDMQGKVGNYVDLLMPMFPGPKTEVDAEQSLGYNGALAQSEVFWKPVLDSGTASFQVPEDYINQMIRHTVMLSLLNTQRDPENGDYTFCTGSWGYDELWPTPVSMVSHMFLNLLGYEKVVDKYSELYRQHQGEVHPPGADYKNTKGYFASPPHVRAVDWLSDHGAVML